MDLRVRKNSEVPDYPYDYTNIKSSPGYMELPSSSTSPKSHSGLSETSEISSEESIDVVSNVPKYKVKPSRPFKAYPDPLSIPLITTATDILGNDSSMAYVKFRQKVLSQVQTRHNGTNNNMRRTQSENPQNTDPAYREKRKKNNEAAKRSRDARKAKEDEIAVRCAFLEQENIQLKFKIAALKYENERFRNMM
ncbi:hypothetical protein NQ314_003057 [Rhamnusium bicolor]|uniref:BZIP domain-containing protein n=1 Tax=Rhamnusium bicolor TaxID=1586634 RepID=A0AAV8ZMY4_9CUCU|nr:hypothetical protein NQ314_003057 [Rhamnusium bicolor]